MFCFTTTAMAYQNQRRMERSGSSTRCVICYLTMIITLISPPPPPPPFPPPPSPIIYSSMQNYTQYIPLSIYDLQFWMGSPSIYVYDCSQAGKSFSAPIFNASCTQAFYTGLVLESFNTFARQRDCEILTEASNNHFLLLCIDAKMAFFNRM